MRTRTLACVLSLPTLMACSGTGASESRDLQGTRTVQAEPVVLTALYTGATWYAGRTDYRFETGGGETTIVVGVSNLDDEPGPEVPDDMLVPDAGYPPGANPVLVGRAFDIAFDAYSRVVSITLANRPMTLSRVTSLENETLGGFAPGTTTDELRGMLGAPGEMRIDPEEEAATGCFFSEWLYPDLAVSFGICGNEQGEGSVRQITASAPSMMKTSSGIGVGSSEAEMRTVYGSLQMMDEDAWVSVTAEVEAGVVRTITLSEMPE